MTLKMELMTKIQVNYHNLMGFSIFAKLQFYFNKNIHTKTFVSFLKTFYVCISAQHMATLFSKQTHADGVNLLSGYDV